MLARVNAPASVGMDGRLVEVECDITNGLPAFVVVGLGNQAVNEARDRVRSAIRNSQLMLPPKRITLNLAPADLPKDGTAYDLSMAIAILLASKQLAEAGSSLFAGELALDGGLRPIAGALAYAQLAAERGIKQLFVPAENAPAAALIDTVAVYGVRSLLEVFGHLQGLEPLERTTPPQVVGQRHNEPDQPDFATVRGQAEAKRALELAAAGGHNVLLSGPPGAGKTMLSRALVGILPPPTLSEMIEITKLHSLTGRTIHNLASQRPFRNPHHTASDIALIGGGRFPRPGEISLAHHGVLFLDELPEFRREVLEALRQPLEDGTVMVARATGSVRFPAQFILVAAQNPCPCGYAGDAQRRCHCSLAQIARYNQKLSGPLLDRIDLMVQVERVDLSQADEVAETTETVAKRVAAARQLAWRDHQENAILNARLANGNLPAACRLSAAAKRLLRASVQTLGLSARGYVRTIKVARTIANIDGRSQVVEADVSEALHFRPAL